MSTKVFHKIITIQVKGDTSGTEAGVTDMLGSVVEALLSQYPKLRMAMEIHDLSGTFIPALVVPVWTKRMKHKRPTIIAEVKPV